MAAIFRDGPVGRQGRGGDAETQGSSYGRAMALDWQTDRRFFSTEERIKHALIPPRLYLRNLAWRRGRKGEKELALLPALAARGSVAIDIGANKGVYSYALSGICGAVKAFEPNPKMFRILTAGVPANVETFETALSNADGEADLILPVQRSGRFSNQGATLQPRKMDGDKDFETLNVAQKTLDSYGFRDVSFIKIDVEGFELEVIEGAKETLARERPNMLVEIDEHHAKRPVADAVAAICAHGYGCFYMSQTSLKPFSAFAGDTAKTHTDNFVFLPVS